MINRGTLNDYLKTFKYPRFSVCQSWFNQILEGLAYLHAHNVVHGYICCDNIYINSNTGELKIGNLCLSKLPEAMNNKFIYRTPLDDIRRFGLLVLEVALAQVLSPSKLRKNMEKLYDLSAFNKREILKFTKHITDDEYRLLVETCISADSNVLIKDIQQLKFLTSIRRKNETLRGIIKKSTNTKDKNEKANSKFNVIIKQNTLKTCPRLESQLISIQVTIVNPQTSYRIRFNYNLTYDTPKAIAQEMRDSLSLPEEYILSIQAQIQVVIQNYINNLNKNLSYYARTEFKTEIGNRSETISENFSREQHPVLHLNSRKPSVSESISPIDTSSVTSICTNNTAIEHMKAFALKYLPSAVPKAVAEREETLQPEVTFSDVQLTPRNEGDEDIDKEIHKK